MKRRTLTNPRSSKPAFASSLILAGATVIAGLPAHAQDDGDEEIFTLSPFTVEGSQDEGYRATSTLAGTRIRTDLKDVGSAISVVTEKFLQDTGAVDNETLLVYTTSTEVGGVNGNFTGLGNGATLDEGGTFTNPSQNTRVRGLAAADNTRNYFITDIPWDGYVVNRVDMQRGPNAILFGLGSPAGIINTTLDTAVFSDETKVEFRIGSYGSRRMTVNANRVLIEDELAVRVAGLTEKENFKQDPAFEEDERIYLAFNYTPKALQSDGSTFSLSGNVESGSINSNRPRTLTPIDRITAFFDPVYDEDGNYSMSGGLGGQTFDPIAVQDNSESGIANGDGQARKYLTDGTTPNPNYIPGIGNFGSLFGGPLVVFDDANSTAISGISIPEPNLYNGIGPDGERDGNIGGMAWGRLTSTTDYPTYAQNAELPYYQYGQYKQVHLSDPTIFDFYNNLLDGPNKSEWANFDSLNLSLSQTFFDNKLGYEAAYFSQDYNDGRTGLFGNGSNQAIFIDTNEYMLDGTPNPNVGRAFISDTDTYANSIFDSQRESYRFTAYYEHDFQDSGRENWFTRLMGQHIFTGLYAKDKLETDRRNFIRYGTTADFAAMTNTQNLTDGKVLINTVHYLGDSLVGQSSASGANLSALKTDHAPSSGSVYYFDATWDASDIDPSALWIDADGNESTQSENPDNYVGWTTTSFDVVDALSGNNIDNMIYNASMSRQEIESEALIWQGYFWDRAIIGTYGWRKDTPTAWTTDAPIDDITRMANVDPSVYNTNYEGVEESGQTQSWSVAVHVNQLLNDRLPFNLSLYYNESENFQPGAGREDMFGNSIAPPTGTTQDKSIMISTKDNRYSLKVTQYKTTIKNISSDWVQGTWFLGQMVTNGTNWANIYDYDLYDGYTLDYVAQEGDANQWRYSYGDSAEAQQLEADAIAGWREFIDAIYAEYPEFVSTWNVNGDLRSEVMEFQQNQPSNIAYVEDVTSEGTEFELTAQPLENWTIAINASKTEAVRNNIGGDALNEWVEFVDYYMNETAAGDIRLWWSGNQPIRNDWLSNVKSNYSRNKLLEGNATPELRKWRFNVVTNYDFRSGFLKGTNIGGSYRWSDKVAIGYPLTYDEDGLITTDIDNPYMGPSEEYVDFWAGYGKSLSDTLNWRIQLNVSNAFSDDSLIPISVQPDGSPAAYRIAPSRTWSITNTFTF